MVDVTIVNGGYNGYKPTYNWVGPILYWGYNNCDYKVGPPQL